MVLAITLMPTLRLYLSQQSDRNALRAQVAEQSRSVQELTKQAQSWNDPAYVEQQARQRLKFVRPGEKSFTVIDPPQAPAAKGTPQVAAGSSGTSPNTPWYGQLWQSLEIADTPGVASSSAPKVPLAPGSTQPPTPGSTPGATSGSTPGSTPGATSESTPGAVSGTGAASGAGSTSGAAAPGAKATR